MSRLPQVLGQISGHLRQRARDREAEDILGHIREVSQNARTTWFGLLALLAFVGVALLAHKDSAFFVRGVKTELPLIGISVPVEGFFFTAPVLVAAVYAYLHLYLETLWAALGRAQPEIDGEPLSEQTYPWLLTRAVLSLRRDGAARPTAMGMLTLVVSVGITWVAGLLALGRFWTESWAVHDPGLSLWIAGWLFAASTVGARSFWVMWCYMRPRKGRVPEAIPLWFDLTWFPFAVVLVYASWQTTHGGLPWGERLLTPFTISADLREVVLVERPDGWQPYDQWFDVFEARYLERRYGTPGIPPPEDWWNLPGSEMRQFWADARRDWSRQVSRLPRHDLRGDDRSGADLRGANLFLATLHRPDLRGAEMQRSYLEQARLQGARLATAQLEGAILLEAKLIGADLEEANLNNANLETAELQGANLLRASMKTASLRSAVLQGAEMEGVELRGANLSGANLSGAMLLLADMFAANLEGIEASDTDFDSADMRGADLSYSRLINSNCDQARFEYSIVKGAYLLCNELHQEQLENSVGDDETRLWSDLFTVSCIVKTSDVLESVITVRISVDADLFDLDREFIREDWLCDEGEEPHKIWGTVPRPE
ncbi:MAG: pentapeptide repeat-containing protein [Pseudomonadota bacterium]